MNSIYRKNRFKKIFNRIVYGSFYRADSQAEKERMKRRYQRNENRRKAWFERKKWEEGRDVPRKYKNVSKKEIVENSSLTLDEVEKLL